MTITTLTLEILKVWNNYVNDIYTLMLDTVLSTIAKEQAMNWWMDREGYIIYIGMLFNHKKENVPLQLFGCSQRSLLEEKQAMHRERSRT